MALLDAAKQAPGTVRELAERAQVGFATAKYTASRMIDTDQLVRVEDGRPARYAAPDCPAIPPGGETLADALQRLHSGYVNEAEEQG